MVGHCPTTALFFAPCTLLTAYIRVELGEDSRGVSLPHPGMQVIVWGLPLILTADGMRAATARQKTLKDANAWSYNLLSEKAQKCFAYLSVFSGGFRLEAAASMFSPSFKDTPVSNLTASLLDKSLLKLATEVEASFVLCIKKDSRLYRSMATRR